MKFKELYIKINSFSPFIAFTILLAILLIIGSVIDVLTNGICNSLLFLCLGVFGWIWAMASTGYLLMRFKNGLKKACLPLAIIISGLLIAWFLPRTLNSIEMNFRIRLRGYEQVIKLVEEGKIQANQIGVAELPEEYDYLSDTGIIHISEENGVLGIVFFRQNGILGEFLGYIYRSDLNPPSYIECNIWRNLKVNYPHWYVCVGE